MRDGRLEHLHLSVLAGPGCRSTKPGLLQRAEREDACFVDAVGFDGDGVAGSRQGLGT